jgi:hypothetical protein
MVVVAPGLLFRPKTAWRSEIRESKCLTVNVQLALLFVWPFVGQCTMVKGHYNRP